MLHTEFERTKNLDKIKEYENDTEGFRFKKLYFAQQTSYLYKLINYIEYRSKFDLLRNEMYESARLNEEVKAKIEFYKAQNNKILLNIERYQRYEFTREYSF